MSGGFAGISYPDVFQVEEQINPMLKAIKSNLGLNVQFYTHKQIQIGSVGTPIAFNEKKTISAIFDGELYNYDELKKDLLSKGFHFHSDNPSEIILRAYEHYGLNFLDKLDGGFALLISDYYKKRLVLARDRIGKKSLYWYHDGKTFVFGTRLKALLSTGLVPHTPALEAIASYFYFGYLPQDLTPVKDINKLLPSHYLLFNFNNSKSIETYWSYSSFFQRSLIKPKKVILDTIDKSLLLSTEKQIPKGGGGVGCFLSGGLGSASAAYYVDKVIKPKPLKAFTVGFQGENDEDVKAAALVAENLMIPQNIEWITTDTFLNHFPRIIWNLDEPIGDPNIIATYRLANLASKEVSCVFSGMGSDELFALHSRYDVEEGDVGLLERLYALPRPMMNLILPLIGFFNKKLSYKFLKKARTNPWQIEYLNQNALFDEKTIHQASPFLAKLFDPEVFLHKFYNLNRIRSNLSSFLYFDVKTRLADNYIFQYERMTSSEDLLWQTPFLDRALFEYLASLEEPDFIEESENGSILKELMKGIFKESFINRPKKTRENFLATWGVRSNFIQLIPLLRKGTLVETGILSEEWMRKITQNDKAITENFKYLFAILVLEVWFRLFLSKQMQFEPVDIDVKTLLSEL